MKNAYARILVAMALAPLACERGTSGPEDAAARKADALAEQYDAIESALTDCVDQLGECLDGAADLDAITACGAEAEACLGAAELEPPALPEPPELPGVDAACFDALDACLQNDPTDPACADDLATCLGVDAPEPGPGPIGDACAEDLAQCLANDPTDPSCLDGFDDCISGELGGLCGALTQQCEDLGAPAELCGLIAC